MDTENEQIAILSAMMKEKTNILTKLRRTKKLNNKIVKRVMRLEASNIFFISVALVSLSLNTVLLII